MAETKSILNLVVADQSSKLSDFAIGHQQIIFLQDKRKIALDYNGKRTFYNHIEILETDAERKELADPIQGIFYFVIGTATLWFYDATWISVTTPPQEIVCIGVEFPELGSENTLYVNKKIGFIGDVLPEIGIENTLYINKEENNEYVAIWDNENKRYRTIAKNHDVISEEDIASLF